MEGCQQFSFRDVFSIYYDMILLWLNNMMMIIVSMWMWSLNITVFRHRIPHASLKSLLFNNHHKCACRKAYPFQSLPHFLLEKVSTKLMFGLFTWNLLNLLPGRMFILLCAHESTIPIVLITNILFSREGGLDFDHVIHVNKLYCSLSWWFLFLNQKGEHSAIGNTFNKLLKEIGNPIEFSLPELFNNWQPSYTSIKRSIHLTTVQSSINHLVLLSFSLSVFPFFLLGVFCSVQCLFGSYVLYSSLLDMPYFSFFNFWHSPDSVSVCWKSTSVIFLLLFCIFVALHA